MTIRATSIVSGCTHHPVCNTTNQHGYVTTIERLQAELREAQKALAESCDEQRNEYYPCQRAIDAEAKLREAHYKLAECVTGLPTEAEAKTAEAKNASLNRKMSVMRNALIKIATRRCIEPCDLAKDTLINLPAEAKKLELGETESVVLGMTGKVS